MQSQVRFNRVLENDQEKVWEALVQVQQSSEEGSGEGSGEGLAGTRQVRFNRVSGEGSGEGLAGFGAEPVQIEQGSGEGFGEGLGGLVWCRASSG